MESLCVSVISLKPFSKITAMIKSRHLIGSTLIVVWAILLGARSIAAAIYGTKVAVSYDWALREIGWVMPTCAWVALVGGLLLLFGRMGRGSSEAVVAEGSPDSRPTQ
jgi:hypothetical protein